MTITDLFRVVIKIIGIYSLSKAMNRLLPRFSVLNGANTFTLIFDVIYMSLLALIVFVFLFQTNRVIKFFRIDRGFDSKVINLKNLNEEGLFKIGILLIGLLLITDNSASFLTFCYLELKKQISVGGLDLVPGAIIPYIHYDTWAISGINILIGVLMLTFNTRILQVFIKTNNKDG
ncbi:hypothetical protein [Maribacter litoralis]|uniref:hypothetical protein n=1 Tax=Maribacter litoralis TaxID=2059726 RepID=UPI003D290ADB